MKLFRIKYIIVLTAICTMAFFSPIEGNGKKVSTRLKAPVVHKDDDPFQLRTYPHHKSEFQLISDKLTFMAYDKRSSADKETFFVDNGSDKTLSSIELEISYFNAAGKLIHKRSVTINDIFPARETHKVDIKSWDTQKSFHYINSVPSKNGSTPYTVKFKVLSFVRK